MRTLRILFGILLVGAAFLSFGVSCHSTGNFNLNWLEHPLPPLAGISKFGQCVANVDRVFSSSAGPVAFGLAVFFLVFAGMVFAAKRRQPVEVAVQES